MPIRSWGNMIQDFSSFHFSPTIIAFGWTPHQLLLCDRAMLIRKCQHVLDRNWSTHESESENPLQSFAANFWALDLGLAYALVVTMWADLRLPCSASPHLSSVLHRWHPDVLAGDLHHPELLVNNLCTVISVIMQRPNFYRKYATPIFDSIFLLILS